LKSQEGSLPELFYPNFNSPLTPLFTEKRGTFTPELSPLTPLFTEKRGTFTPELSPLTPLFTEKRG